jgi:DNA polymerase sigma
MRANTHVSSSVTDVVDILDANYDDLFCDYNTLTTVNSVTNTRTIHQTPCETISIIKMITISKHLVWPRDLESVKGGNFNTLSLVDCYVQICNGTAVEHLLCNILML